MPDGLGFLAIADLNLGSPDCKLTWPDYRDELERDLRREHDRTGPWDVVFVVGQLYAMGPTSEAKADLRGLFASVRALGSTPRWIEAQRQAPSDLESPLLTQHDARGNLLGLSESVRLADPTRVPLYIQARGGGQGDVHVEVQLGDADPIGSAGIRLVPAGRLNRATLLSGGRWTVPVPSLLGGGVFEGYLCGRILASRIELRARAITDGIFGPDPGYLNSTTFLSLPGVEAEDTAVPDAPLETATSAAEAGPTEAEESTVARKRAEAAAGASPSASPAPEVAPHPKSMLAGPQWSRVEEPPQVPQGVSVVEAWQHWSLVAQLTCLEVEPGGARVAVASSRELYLFDVAAARWRRYVADGLIAELGWTGDGRLFVQTGSGGRVYALDETLTPSGTLRVAPLSAPTRIRLVRHRDAESRPGALFALSGAGVARPQHAADGQSLWARGDTVLLGPYDAPEVLLAGVAPRSLAWLAHDASVVVATAQGELIVLEADGELRTTVDAHADPIVATAASPDGRLLASASSEGEVKLWRTGDWAVVGRWSYDDDPPAGECMQFFAGPDDQGRWTLAVGRRATLELLTVDPAIVEQEVVAQAAAHVSAKVVIVGAGGVGKTSLAHRLVSGAYEEFPSTHGMRFWRLPLLRAQGEGAGESAAPRREAFLWDLGGQSEYRLLHQLFLPETELALVLTDPRRQAESYSDAREWAARLSAVGEVPRILVGTKVDDADDVVDRAALDVLARQCECKQTVLTSARTGHGIDDLVEALRTHVPWDELAREVQGPALTWLVEQVDRRRQNGQVVVGFRRLEEEARQDGGPDGADLLTATAQLARRGSIATTRLSDGEKVLVLQVEHLERYGGSLILAAKAAPSGVPAIDASALLRASMSFPRIPDEQRLPRKQERVILECVFELLVERGLALFHHGQLVFPSLFATEAEHAPPAAAVEFDLPVAAKGIYASLVAELALARAYGEPRLSGDTARFTRAGVGTCGVRWIPGRDDRGRITVFFEEDVAEATEWTFVGYVEDHLKTHGIRVVSSTQIACQACTQPFPAGAVEARVARGLTDILCSFCEARTRILLGPDEARRRDAELPARTAAQRERADFERHRRVDAGKRAVERGAQAGPGSWILMLSDLHIGADTDVATMVQTLLADLRDARTGPAPENFAALVISGDLTDRASLAEFENVYRFLTKLVRELPGVTPSNTVLVPGNHDVDWSRDGVYRVHMGAPPTGRSAHEVVQRGDIVLVRDEAEYRRSFENFSRGVYHPFFSRPYPLDPSRQAIVRDVPDAGLAFLALNSAYNTARYSPDAATIVDAAVTEGLTRLAKVPGERLKIAVWHHPITGNEKIASDAFVERLAQAGVKLCLHGHVHQSRTGSLLHHQGKVHAIGAGTFGAMGEERPESTPRLYHLLELSDDRGGLRVYSRGAPRQGGAWRPWAEWPDREDPAHPKPYYDLDLG